MTTRASPSPSSADVEADVVIVGAGMAGATLALALAKGNLSCILVDSLPFEALAAPDFDGRASAISFAAWRQWRVLGAARALEPHAQRIEQILVTDGRPTGASAAGASGSGYALTPPRSRNATGANPWVT